jgi:hypothetical protein
MQGVGSLLPSLTVLREVLNCDAMPPSPPPSTTTLQSALDEAQAVPSSAPSVARLAPRHSRLQIPANSQSYSRSRDVFGSAPVSQLDPYSGSASYSGSTMHMLDDDDSDGDHSAYSLALRGQQPPASATRFASQPRPPTFQESRAPQPSVLELLERETERRRRMGLDQSGQQSVPGSRPPDTPSQPSTQVTTNRASSDRQPSYTAQEDRILTEVLLSVVMEGAAPDNNFKGAHYQLVADTINKGINGRSRDLKSVKNRHAYVSLRRIVFAPVC